MTYKCPHHGTEQDSACPQCVEEYQHLPDPATMTGDERAAEMERWLGVLTLDFSDVHKRVEGLVGRSVWTHEMGEASAQALIDEARLRPGRLDPDAVLNKWPADKPLFVAKVPQP
jgi:hypothetical protein